MLWNNIFFLNGGIENNGVRVKQQPSAIPLGTIRFLTNQPSDKHVGTGEEGQGVPPLEKWLYDPPRKISRFSMGALTPPQASMTVPSYDGITISIMHV